MSDKISRKQQILQSLVQMLESSSGGRITTATLAKEVGVSEAALYRHFPSKAKMFEALIDYSEEALFTRIRSIVTSEKSTLHKCDDIAWLILSFCEKNPGLARILNGDALVGETDKLQQRIVQLFDRLELQLKQLLREAEMKEKCRTRITVTETTGLLMNTVEGKIASFVRSGFKRKPTEGWSEQWSLLAEIIFC